MDPIPPPFNFKKSDNSKSHHKRFLSRHDTQDLTTTGKKAGVTITPERTPGPVCPVLKKNSCLYTTAFDIFLAAHTLISKSSRHPTDHQQ